MSNKEETRAFIRKNYAALAQNGAAGGCCSSGCSCSGDSLDINETTMNMATKQVTLPMPLWHPIWGWVVETPSPSPSLKKVK